MKTERSFPTVKGIPYSDAIKAMVVNDSVIGRGLISRSPDRDPVVRGEALRG